MGKKPHNLPVASWRPLLVPCLIVCLQLLATLPARAQAPGTAPVSISNKTQMLHGRKYYVHIVEKGQTVYSISKAYKVESYDAVTHVDIHFLHPGDTVWLPCRGQFTTAAEELPAPTTSTPPSSTPPSSTPPATPQPTPTTNTPTTPPPTPINVKITPEVRPINNTLKVAVMMPLHLDQVGEISTSKFDIEQRGKKSYKQFEFIEFYEGILLALDALTAQGINIELNVVDIPDNTATAVEQAFASHNIGQSDLLIALLLRDAFDRAAQLAQASNIYIVNPMATRSEICTDNPYVVKIQPSLEGMTNILLNNIHTERPNTHLYIIHSNSKAEKPLLNELKKQLDTRQDIPYTIFNWSQSARLANTLKATPGSTIVSIYDQGKDNNRVYVGNLLNRLAAFKAQPPTLYSYTDWTHEYNDIDFAQLQQLNYHTFSTSWDMTNQVHIDFLQAYRNRFSTEPTTPLAATGYDLMLYLGEGLHRHKNTFWNNPTNTLPTLIHPLHLVRSNSGLENNRATLYLMDSYRFIPAALK